MLVLETMGQYRVVEIVETNSLGWETTYNVQIRRMDNGTEIWETIAMFLWDDDAFLWANICENK